MPSGWTWVDGCEDDPGRARTVNALAPEAVAQECARQGAGLVYYSTEYVFGESGGPYDELAKPDPVGVYGASKLEGEQRVLEACPEALSLRTTVIYGPEPQGKNFVYQLVKNLVAGKPMTVPTDQLSSPTYNRDLARASVELVEGLERGIWNVAGPEVIDRATFAHLAAAVFGLDGGLLKPTDTPSMKQKARRPLSAGLRIEKLVERLGWKPLGPLEALAATKAEMERNGQLSALKGMA
jgi:dTDP-4-dehydrorhamnose reductase